jgi:hypothetical protein
MGSSPFNRFLQKLAADPALRDLVPASQLQARTELLKRAAVLREFDQAIYEEVLSKDLGDKLDVPPFNLFKQSPEIDGDQSRYWVRDGLRRTYLQEWQEKKEERDRLCHRLAISLGTKATDLELLELELQSDPQAAATRFERLYLEADRLADLGRCYSLLSTLEVHAKNIPVAKSLWDQYEPLYLTRSQFTHAFHKTARYVRRTGIEREFRRFLRKDHPQWIFNLHGPGGMGKTMLVNWLISRRLGQRRFRVPCARIDFDHYPFSTLSDCTWLLMVPLLEQLNPQVGNAFLSLVISMGPFRPLLTQSDDIKNRDEMQELLNKAAGSDFWPHVKGTFNSLGDRLIVLFLDTFEEPALHSPELVANLLKWLNEIQAAVPRLRLVISGRYKLGEELLPEYQGSYASATQFQDVGRLSAADSARLLRAIAGTLSPGVVKAAHKRTKGNPFQLALIAELLQGDASITRERILGPEFDNIEEAYLIDRVVCRIPIKEQLPVRWVVRYGVIPRVLSQDFLKSVLLPHLEQGISGKLKETGDDRVDEYLRKNPWPFGREAAFDPATVWQQLNDYASPRGWINSIGQPPMAVRLHPDVVQPMRRLLRKQRVFRKLHEMALEYFTRHDSLADMLFHKLQLNPGSELDEWRRVFSRPNIRANPAVRKPLAQDLTQKDFDEACEEAREFARSQLAEANAELIAAEENYTFFLSASRFKLVEKELGRTNPGAPSSIRICFEAAQKAQSDKLAALYLLEQQLTNPEWDQIDRVRLLLHAAELVTAEKASRYLQKAADIAAKLGNESPVQEGAILEILARSSARRGDWMEALDAFKNAAQSFRDHQPKSAEVSDRHAVEVQMSIGRWHDAFSRLRDMEGLKPDDEPKDPRFFDLHARVQLGLRRPVAALDFALSIEGGPAEMAERTFLMAEAMGMQYRLGEAAQLYSQARTAFEKLGFAHGMDRCRVANARLCTMICGDLAEGQRQIEQGPLGAAARNPTMHAQWELLRAYVASERGNRAEARALLLERAAPEAPGQSRQQVALFLMATLSLGDLEHVPPELLDRLEGALATVEPASARMSLLEPLLLGRRWPVLPKKRQRVLLKILNPTPHRCERAVFGLLRAELLRVLGRGEEAAELLKTAIPKPDSNVDDHFQYLQRLQAERRLIWDGVRVPAHFASNDAFEVLSRLPMASSILHLEMGERALETDQLDLAQPWLSEAEATLSKEHPVTIYHARCRDLFARLNSSVEAGDAIWLKLGRKRGTQTAESTRRSMLEATTSSIRPKVIDLRFESGALWLQTPTIKRKLDKGLYPIVDRISRLQERMPYWLFETIAENWQSVAEQLSALLRLSYSPTEVERASPVRRLFLTAPQGILSSLPWSFITEIRHPAGRDNYKAPVIRDEYTDWSPPEQRPREDQPASPMKTSVLVLTPSEERRFDYEKIVHTYMRAGCFVEGRYIDKTINKISRAPAIIHVAGRIIDSPSLPLPSLGNLMPQDLDRILRFSNRDYRPALILDATLPEGSFDAAQAVVARNRYAFELFGCGNLGCVIATGLAEESASLPEKFASAVARNLSQEQLADELRELWRPDSDLTNVLSSLGVTLFSHAPSVQIAVAQPVL